MVAEEVWGGSGWFIKKKNIFAAVNDVFLKHYTRPWVPLVKQEMFKKLNSVN